jgi:hypothetical protein
LGSVVKNKNYRRRLTGGVFLAVNAFRYGLTGYSEATVLLAPLVLLALNLALAGLAWRLFARGYKIRP